MFKFFRNILNGIEHRTYDNIIETYRLQTHKSLDEIFQVAKRPEIKTRVLSFYREHTIELDEIHRCLNKAIAIGQPIAENPKLNSLLRAIAVEIQKPASLQSLNDLNDIVEQEIQASRAESI